MVANTFVVYDPDDAARLAALAPNRVQPDCCALRLEPTPSKRKEQLVDDLLTALRRRPRLAMRWSDGDPTDSEIAGMWATAHKLRHIVVARAHTLNTARLASFIREVSPAMRGHRITWWLVDASNDGQTAREFEPLGALSATPDQMRAEIESTQYVQEGEGCYRTEPEPRRAQLAVCDAHPALFIDRIQRTLPPSESTAAMRRADGVQTIMSESGAFGDWRSALWYCLRAARDPADALVITRAAQLTLLRNRAHLTMAVGAWEASQAARAHVSDQVEHLLAYVDPLVAAIGALALQTGFRPSRLAALTGDHARSRKVPALGGLDTGDTDPYVAMLLRAQIGVWETAGRPRRFLVRWKRDPYDAQRVARDTAVATDARITAILRTISIERSMQFDHEGWAQKIGVALLAL